MSNILQQSTAAVGYSFGLEPVYTQSTPSLYDIKVDSMTPLTATPGSNVSLSLTFNKSVINVQQNNEMLFMFDLSSADGTNVMTIQNILGLLKSISISINDGEEIKVNSGIQIKSLFSDFLRDNAKNLYSKLQLTRSTEWVDGTFTGITPSTDKRCYVDLFALYPSLRGFISHEKGIRSMKFTFEFASIPSSAGDAGLICVSSTTSNAYNSSVSFKNCSLLRMITRINDSALLAQPTGDKHLMLVNRSDLKVVSGVDWNTIGNEYSFKVSDYCKKANLKSVKCAFYNRSGTSAYNSVSSEKLYSGAKYISFKIGEIGGATDYSLDLRGDQHLSYMYEIQSQQRRAGGYTLPNSLLTHTNNLG